VYGTSWAADASATDHAFDVFNETSNQWGTIVQAIASTATDFVPTGIIASFYITTTATSVSGAMFEFEIMTGAGGSEVTYAHFSESFVAYQTISGASAIIKAYKTFPCSTQLIPAGTRISLKVLSNVTSGAYLGKVSFVFTGYDGGAVPAMFPMYSRRAHLAGIHNSQVKGTPTGSYLTVTSGTYSTYGTYVEVIASATSDLLVLGVVIQATSNTSGSAVCFGLSTGASPNEVMRAVLPFSSAGVGWLCNSGYASLITPFVVKAGERLAIASAGSGSAIYPDYIQVLYEEL
jgi:hypothetical protein